MKEDKTLLPFASYPTLTEYQYRRLSKLFQTVYISCKDPKKFSFEANYIVDDDPELYAPTAGFIATFKTIKDDRFFALSVDAPFIDKKTILQIINEDTNVVDATIAKTNEGIQPLCGIYHRSLNDQFCTMQKENTHKLGYLLKNATTHYSFFHDTKPFLNMNHPEDYKKALSLI
jgi:molybdopterin-guanine dinucleotide biosynthesis protein A